MKVIVIVYTMLLGMSIVGCNRENSDIVEESSKVTANTRGIVPMRVDFTSTTPINNKAAYVTSQCYTKTKDAQGNAHNPCFACHTNSKEPNYVNDSDIQVQRTMGEYTQINRFSNLFKDRTDLVEQISDDEIETYVRKNNYIKEGRLLLADRLNAVPAEWDVNKNGKWDGYVPDCYFNFDAQGFDVSPKGEASGWRAFGYYPFLGTFWPTNGSTDDVLIRLPKAFMQGVDKVYDQEVYALNLSIVEALIKQKDVAISPTDEKKHGVDLNQNGRLDEANEVVFKWVKPSYNPGTGKISGFSMSYVGLAKERLEDNTYLIAPGLYPRLTEFLHSVRYIDADEQGIKMAARMKELRYAIKTSWISYAHLSNVTSTDIKEKDVFPDRLRTIMGNTEKGLSNNMGWMFQGFIEDAKGELRPQNYEETQFCIGCHSGIGAIADSTFVFQRKFGEEHFQKGWYHWSQDANGLKNIKEPKTADGRGEYALYLEHNHAGDEFRTNDEVMAKFFDEKGQLKAEEKARLQGDISHLLYPSVKRAMELNKAYKIIVEEQSYIYGRDAHIKPIDNVLKEVGKDELTGIENPVEYLY